MRLIAWTLAAALVLPVVVVSAARAADETIVVDPVNGEILLGMFRPLERIAPVARPETVCGTPNGNPLNKVKCYEFSFTYTTYDEAGNTIMHLPECNAVDHLDPDCENPLNNLCPANPPFGPLKAPVCGQLDVVILPFTSPNPLTLGQQPTGQWDGTTVTPFGLSYVEFSRNGSLASQTFHSPLIRIPQSAVIGMTPGLGIIRGEHTSLSGATIDFGFFNRLNHLSTFSQTSGDVANLIASPAYFQQ
jgi:hypothetical protein